MPRIRPADQALHRSRAQVLAELWAERQREGPQTLKQWSQATLPTVPPVPGGKSAAVSAGSISQILGGTQRPTEATAKRLAKALRVSEEEFEARCLERLQANQASRPSVLPGALIPISVDGFLLRWASRRFPLNERDLGVDASVDAPPVGSLSMAFLARPLRSLRANLLAPVEHVEDPTHRLAPLTYMSLESAIQKQDQEASRGRRPNLLALDGWYMELKGGEYGLVKPDLTRNFANSESKFTAEFRALETLKSKDPDREALGKLFERQVLKNQPPARILVESERGLARVNRLLASICSNKPEIKPEDLAQVHRISSTSSYMEAMKLGLLLDDVYLVVGHSQLWAMRRAEGVPFELIVSDQDRLPGTVPGPRARVLLANGDLMAPEQLEATARWFIRISTSLRRAWEAEFSDIQGYISQELERYGAPGLEYTTKTLKAAIDQGIQLSPEASWRPRFVPLDKFISKQFPEVAQLRGQSRQQG